MHVFFALASATLFLCCVILLCLDLISSVSCKAGLDFCREKPVSARHEV